MCTVGIKKLVFTIDNPAGPKGYMVSKDADITVVCKQLLSIHRICLTGAPIQNQ